MATFSENWLSYSVGQIPSDHYKIWDQTSGVNQGATVQANTDWVGTPNALRMNNITWGAVLYTGVQFSNSSLTIKYRGDSDRCNLAWNMQSNALDGVTNVSGYIWQYVPSTHVSSIGTYWQGGISQLNVITTGIYISTNNSDMNFVMNQVGSSITCTINGAVVHNITDNSFPNSSGYIGFQNFQGTTWRGLLVSSITPLASKNQSSIISEIQ